KMRYYTPYEVLAHNTYDDLWVSLLGKVYNLSQLSEKNKGSILMKPIIEAAGKDISHWFDEITEEPRRYLDPLTNISLIYTPYGRYVHVPPPYPSSDWANDFGTPWWKDSNYYIGHLTKKTRKLKIINTLTSQQDVCSEETINEILRRYLAYNLHANSYTWKYDGVVLDMNKTLEENGIKDDDFEFYNLKMDDTEYLQYVHLYFNDDLTVID
ncbi:hypothetical protein HELRODRAFT_67728, partial [Helobdella robusta]|uniref:Cytochrome b5 domain-containing protein 1 n=1 Tax=Helobdella robusta TaxID=6412 RepID=T1FZ45_HELRO